MALISFEGRIHWIWLKIYDLNMVVSENSGFSPKSSILIGFSILTIHFGGFPPIFGNTHINEQGANFY